MRSGSFYCLRRFRVIAGALAIIISTMARPAIIVVVALLDAGCAGEEVANNNLPVRCLDEPDPGPCRSRVIRYYYDYRQDRCRTFHYSGCGGRVPFETLDSCKKSCVSHAG